MDTWHSLDTLERFVRLINPSAAKQIEQMKKGFSLEEASMQRDDAFSKESLDIELGNKIQMHLAIHVPSMLTEDEFIGSVEPTAHSGENGHRIQSMMGSSSS